jgi:hypothetical protein
MEANRNRGFVLEGMACAIVDRALVSWFVVEVSQEGRLEGGGLSDYDLAYVRRWLYNEKRRKRSTTGRSTRTGHREREREESDERMGG